MSDSETIQSIDNQNQLQGNKYAPTSKSNISVCLEFAPRSQNFVHVAPQQCTQSVRYPDSFNSVRPQIRLPQGVDMRSKSSPQRGEEAFLSEQTRTLGVQVRGEINSHFEEQHLQSCANITRHAEEQHLQSAECWLKTHAVCKTFQPNVGTFNANVVIGKRSIPFHFTNNAMFRAKALNMTNVAYKHSRHTEQSEVSHNRENITNNAILRGLNNYSPQEDGEKSCRLMRGEVGKSKCKAAFTLAETLITLGIIGVVAVMTIPNIIVAH